MGFLSNLRTGVINSKNMRGIAQDRGRDVPGFERMDFRGQPLQAPIAMPRNPEMVEQINQQMFPQPIPQVRSPLQNASDNIKRQIASQPFLQQPKVQTGGIRGIPGNLPPLKRAIDAPGGGGIDYGGGSIDKIFEDQRGGMRPSLGEDDNRQGMRPPQQLLPLGGNPPPPTSYIDEQKKFELEMAQQQSLLNQQQSPLAPPMAPPINKRNDFMSIAQDPNDIKKPLSIGGFGGLDGRPERISDNQFNNLPVEFARSPRTADFQDFNGDGTDDRDQQRPNVAELPNPSDLFGGRPGEPEPINFGQPPVGPVNPGTAPVSPPPTNGMPPVNPNLTGVTQTNPSVPVNPTTTAAPGIPVNPNSVDPVLQEQVINENVTDPLLRSLYFGNENEPGFYNQLQTAGANLIGSDVPTQATSGLDPLEQMARNQAVSQSGDYQAFLDQAQDQYGQGLTSALSGIDEAKQLASQTTDVFGRQLSNVEQRGEGAAGRFADETRSLEQRAAGDVGQYAGALGESEDLLRGTLGGYDQRMTGDFYNPYEDQVVQQTIDDVMKAGDKQDIAARAQAIGSGAFGGSRARLGADERREALGRGLGQALGNIRSGGFQQAQQAGMGEFARQQNARRAASSGLGGLAGSRLGAQQGLSNRMGSGAQQRLAADKGVIDLLGQGAQSRYGAGSNLASNFQQYGQNAANARSNMGGNMLNIGGQGFDLGARSRQELTGLGQASRGIQDIINQRQYTQQTQQQLRPMQTLQGIGGMLPGYQGSSSQIKSAYGMPVDPTAAGLGAAFSAYGALVPNSSGN